MNRSCKLITAAVLTAALLFCSSCNLIRVFDLERESAAPASETTAAAPQVTVTEQPVTEMPTVPAETTTAAPVETTAEPTTAAAQLSVQEVIDLYANALNQTRSYQGTVNVHHKETFSGNVVEAQPLGALATRLANRIVDMVSDPHDSTLTFTGGVGTNEDGETVPILLPKKGAFSLPAAGVRNAYMDTANGMRHVVINLLPESVGLNEVPYYNSGAIGYLDTSSLDLSIIKINSCTITYTGSVIDAYIRDDGYIASVNYTINMGVEASVTGLGITGGGTMEGVEYETWELLW
ncbi:MAG: hypothetical protein IJK89_07210 [Clostridia bacterium]|nr:hypothetical protein [Clostridia bacterium]